MNKILFMRIYVKWETFMNIQIITSRVKLDRASHDKWKDKKNEIITYITKL